MGEEFEKGKNMRSNGECNGKEIGKEPSRRTRILRFVCPRCGCRDLRTKILVAYYPTATLDGIEVDAETLEVEEFHQREDPFDWIGTNHHDGWEFWCDVCHLVPNLEPYGEQETQADQLLQWLLDNCPQTDECVNATGNQGHED